MIMSQLYEERGKSAVTKFKTMNEAIAYYSKEGYHIEKISKNKVVAAKDGSDFIIILWGT